MSKSKRPKPIYERGPFRLHRRPDRTNLQIVWYDEQSRRERSISAGTRDDQEGVLALDRHYLTAMGRKCCPTCGREYQGELAPLLSNVIADYLLRIEHQAGFKSARSRLGHVVAYLEITDPVTTVPMIDARWVEGFRKWLLAQPFKKGRVKRERSIASVEGCVMQLAAAINSTPGQRAKFKGVQLKEVSQSPEYRADVPLLAAMFRFCLDPHAPEGTSWTPKELERTKAYRANLLRFLRIAVSTWARPDAIFDLTSAQWNSAAGVLDLNPRSRRQTKKYRPKIPLARQMRPWLDELDGPYLPVTTVRASWEKMRTELGLPKQGQAGEKLIRRSMSTLARTRLGEERWQQGEMMLGHRKASISDIYALPDPANLGRVLAVTEEIIDEIEALAPGAFTAVLPQG